MKNLYILIRNCGDGACYPVYTFNEEWIKIMEKEKDNSNFDYEAWSDGDGFHYDILTVPDECTLDSLGISYDCAGYKINNCGV